MESVRREPVPVLRRLVYRYTGFHLPEVSGICARGSWIRSG